MKSEREHGGLAAVRDEDSFDVARMHEWLSSEAKDDLGFLRFGPPSVEQFTGGASNLTYLLTYGQDKLVLRRPPRGHKAVSAHDMGREVAIQQALRGHFDFTPQIHAFCQDDAVIGDDFYVMEFVAGDVLRARLPEGLSIGPKQARELAETFVTKWAGLHALTPNEVGLADISKGEGYVSRQVSGWAGRYRAALTDDVPAADALIDWLFANQPDDSGASVIHNDWRFDNLVLDLHGGTRLVGVLDWELATVGDPLMDLGASLAYWVQADDEPGFRAFRRQPTDLVGMPTRTELVQMYSDASGRAVDNWVFYQVFGLFRLAGIVQQIWYRYRRGETTNPAFASFGLASNMLIMRAEQLAF